MRFFSLRAIFLIGFIVVMPVFALPGVAKRIDEWLYGAPPADFGRPPIAPPIHAEAPAAIAPSPVVKSAIAPARFEESSPVPQNLVYTAEGLSQPVPASRYEPSASPLLPASPPFTAEPATPGAAEPKIDEQTIARLQKIRERLEQLGAEYVLVDVQDSGRFRFHCRMLVDPRTRYTRPFDATSFDPIAAGDQVLNEVEKWRATAATIAAPTGQ